MRGVDNRAEFVSLVVSKLEVDQTSIVSTPAVDSSASNLPRGPQTRFIVPEMSFLKHTEYYTVCVTSKSDPAQRHDLIFCILSSWAFLPKQMSQKSRKRIIRWH
jgi:hypothetical protein